MKRYLVPSVEAAKRELEWKSHEEIERETAMKWTGRACAAAELDLLRDASDYAHEAVEHAALTGDAELLRDVWEALREYGIEF